MVANNFIGEEVCWSCWSQNIITVKPILL